MLNKNMSKSEIEKELENKGDFVKIDYLTRLLTENPPIHVKKFIYLKLAEIYEGRKMPREAAKMFNSAGILCIAFTDKIKYYAREAELYIITGVFDKADQAVKKAMNQANSKGKEEIYSKFKEFYKSQAEIYEKELKRNNAAKIYEKLLEMKISDEERQEIKNKLIQLYEKLGKRDIFK